MFAGDIASKSSSSQSKRVYAGWHGLQIRMATGFACIRAKTVRLDKSLRLARCGHYRPGVAAQFLKMKLIYTATVALRNCNEIVIDLNLLALLRQVTKQMRDITADGAHVRALQFELRELV